MLFKCRKNLLKTYPVISEYQMKDFIVSFLLRDFFSSCRCVVWEKIAV